MFAVGEFQSINEAGDRKGVTFNDDLSVSMPPGFKEAYAQYVETGFAALCENPDYGGMGAPYTLSLLANEILLATPAILNRFEELTAKVAKRDHKVSRLKYRSRDLQKRLEKLEQQYRELSERFESV